MGGVFVGTGLLLVALSGALTGIGHYDGVLGTAEPQSLLSETPSLPVTVRVTVTGTVEDARREFDAYRNELVLPLAMAESMTDAVYVPVQIQSEEPVDARAFLQVLDVVPEPGAVVVVRGLVQTEWPLFDTGANALQFLPVVFIQSNEYHPPILFKA